MSKKPQGRVRQKQKPRQEGMGKLLTLQEAIKRYVKPGMKLHLAGGIGGPSAAICEMTRQFHSKTPEFTLIQSTITGHALNLIHCGLIKKMVFAAAVDISDSARPSQIIQKAYREKKIEMENWSLCSLQQRLMAGALGLPFIPTKSITGSNIALDHVESFQEIEDPFKSGTTVGAVKALHPDLSIVHGCVADVHGNTILAAPYGEDLWGPFASIGGVVVTVEKIVDTDLIKKYSALVKIPAHVVNAVCLAPLGVHPFSLFNAGGIKFAIYGQDDPFLMELHQACRERRLDDWIKKWVFDCPTHEDYLNKLGDQRIEMLKKSGAQDTVSNDLPQPVVETLLPPPSKKPYGQETMTLIVLAREIVRSVQKSKYKTILVGGGSRAIAAWLAYYLLKKEGYAVDLMIGNGQIGYTPQQGESIVQSMAVMRSATMLTDSILTQGVFVGGRNNKCLSVLGAGQIDPYGSLNSTKTMDGEFLTGSGGANDAVNAQEVIVVIDQSRNRFVEHLPYITCPGHRVSTVVSTMGVFRKTGPQEKLSLGACFPDPHLTILEERIKRIQENCGFPLKLADPVEEMAEPNDYELLLKDWLLSPPSSRIN
jgi:acyl CoA:acetate/3-ketoacid CoA transferase alpha subunit/acyl CoA:acetate/3-ketoacid CoA transferase beta subunit